MMLSKARLKTLIKLVDKAAHEKLWKELRFKNKLTKKKQCV